MLYPSKLLKCRGRFFWGGFKLRNLDPSNLGL